MDRNDIANYREIEAGKITNMNIWREVVFNILSMKADKEQKISILLQAIPDLAIIMTQLSLCNSKGIIENAEYTELAKECLLQVQNGSKNQKFDPTRYVDFNGSASR